MGVVSGRAAGRTRTSPRQALPGLPFPTLAVSLTFDPCIPQICPQPGLVHQSAAPIPCCASSEGMQLVREVRLGIESSCPACPPSCSSWMMWRGTMPVDTTAVPGALSGKACLSTVLLCWLTYIAVCCSLFCADHRFTLTSQACAWAILHILVKLR